ncbi:beta-mannosidase [Psychroserpens sp. BH13MA-6]
MKCSVWSLLVLCLMSCQPNHDTPLTIEIQEAWQFRNVQDTVWHQAEVPGNIHTDLLSNDLIPHPYIGANADSLQWISKTDWEYKTVFSIDENTLQKHHLSLHFKGLDTYANVFLNDSLILRTDNAFRAYDVDVKPLLKLKNDLRIIFERTSVAEEQEQKALPYQLPEGNRIFTRKAQFQYGWDWGPKLNTSGIWQPIELQAWNDFKIHDIHLKQEELTNKKAIVKVQLSTTNHIKDDLDYDIYLNDQLYKTYEDQPKQYKFDLDPITVEIDNPKRWWPHNIGEPYLYHIKVVVRNDQKILDSISVKKGLRTVELVTEKDSIGESFYFKVNNMPVYMKGANYIPQNTMQNKVSIADYDTLLEDVKNANMNMLRVWGGGIYESDNFYDLCDEKGLLIWQDFMFACAMYPGDKAFLTNVKKEAEYQVKRLRNHPSIVLWCGNNESSEGWHRWGWQAERSEQEKDEIWHNYNLLFKGILPKVIDDKTDLPYWESSPKYGRGNPKYETEGDAHDWWVWHDGYPFEHFESHVPRFMSEFGFQSFPSFETIRYINQSDALTINSDAFKTHQKHHRGFELIAEYMARDFPTPTEPEDYVYVSQLLQAYGITKGIEAHRRAKPYNMGTLYWQLNDCWPAISWSSIDYFGNWKALHYQAKKSFENILISSELSNDTLKTYIINDNLVKQQGAFTITAMDFDGQTLWKHTEQMEVPASSSEAIHLLHLDNLEIEKDQVVLVMKFNEVTTYQYLVKPKKLKLKEQPIESTIEKTANGFKVTLKSSTLQKYVFLNTKVSGHFSDNYFDLLPNERVEIEFSTEATSLDDLKLLSLNSLVD